MQLERRCGVANALWKIGTIAWTVYETFQDVKGLANDLKDSGEDDEGEEDEEEEDEELTEEEMQSSDFRKALDKLEREKKLNSPEYLRYKQKYLESLIKENNYNGNKDIADLAQKYLDNAKNDGVQNIDLTAFDKDVEKIKLSKEAEEMKTLLTTDSMKDLLKDESKSNYVRWLEIFNRAINSIKITLYNKLEYNYKEIIESNFVKYFEPQTLSYKFHYDFHVPSLIEDVSDEKLYKIKPENKNFVDDMINKFSIDKVFAGFKKYTLEHLIEKSPKIQKEMVYCDEKAQPFYIIKEKENNAQIQKYNLWVDILYALDINDTYKNKYQKQNLT